MREVGDGERAARSASRCFWALLIGFGIAGALIGMLHMWLAGGEITGSISPGGAVALAALWVVIAGGGSWFFFSRVDELEIRDNIWAGTAAFYFYTLAYPAWYALWKGALVPQPSHEMLFIGTMAVLTIAYLIRKIIP